MSDTRTPSICEPGRRDELFNPPVEPCVDAESDSETSASDHSETNADVMRLVHSTRRLMRTSSQESSTVRHIIPFIRFGSDEDVWHRNKTRISQTQSNPTQSDAPSDRAPLNPATRGSLDGARFLGYSDRESLPDFEHRQRKPVSLQNLNIATPQSPTDPLLSMEPDYVHAELYGCHKAATENLPPIPSTLKPKADSTMHKSLEKLEPDQSKGTRPPMGYATSDVTGEKLDTETHSAYFSQALPECPHASGPRYYGSTSGPSSIKRTKIGLPFFRPKQTSPNQSKAMQMKELKRMIRAGKPSYEQIHSWGHSFETLLNDRFGLALFKEFLSTEFSDENIEFWIACQEYKQITNPKKLAARAQRIFSEFIAVQANREVNLDSKTRLQTEADLANPTIHTLDNAQKRIQALMEKDSYRRFLRSEVYMTLYTEAREVAKAAAATALAASLQEASDELDGAVLNLVNSSSSTSPFSFLSNFSSGFTGPLGPGLHLPGVAAAAASAEAGMNSVQDLQLLGLSTSRHMRCMQAASGAARTANRQKTDTRLTTAAQPSTTPTSTASCPVTSTNNTSVQTNNNDVITSTTTATATTTTISSTANIAAVCEQDSKIG